MDIFPDTRYITFSSSSKWGGRVLTFLFKGHILAQSGLNLDFLQANASNWCCSLPACSVCLLQCEKAHCPEQVACPGWLKHAVRQSAEADFCYLADFKCLALEKAGRNRSRTCDITLNLSW